MPEIENKFLSLIEIEISVNFLFKLAKEKNSEEKKIVNDMIENCHNLTFARHAIERKKKNTDSMNERRKKSLHKMQAQKAIHGF